MWTRWLRNPVLARKPNKEKLISLIASLTFINMQYVHLNLRKSSWYGLSEGVASKELLCTMIILVRVFNGYKTSTEVLHQYDTETGEKVDVTSGIQSDTEIEGDGLPERRGPPEPAVMGSGGDAFYCGGDNGPSPQHFVKVGCVHRLKT